MEKTLSTVAVLVFFVAMFAAMITLPPKGSKEVEKAVQKRTVKIMAISAWGGSQGTGTLIGNNHILTNSHLFPPELVNPTIVFRRYNDTEFYPAVVVSSSTKQDYAVLKFKGEDNTKPLIYTKNWRLGEPVILIGNPEEEDFQMGTARVIGAAYIPNPWRYVRNLLMITCGSGKPGYSGSGIYNQQGEFLGIFELKNQLVDVCFGIPAKELEDIGVTNPQYMEDK